MYENYASYINNPWHPKHQYPNLQTNFCQEPFPKVAAKWNENGLFNCKNIPSTTKQNARKLQHTSLFEKVNMTQMKSITTNKHRIIKDIDVSNAEVSMAVHNYTQSIRQTLAI